MKLDMVRAIAFVTQRSWRGVSNGEKYFTMCFSLFTTGTPALISSKSWIKGALCA